MDTLDKAIKVIDSCTTLDQLRVAAKYCALATKNMPVRSLLLGNIIQAKIIALGLKS